jgi:phosphoenolpyruvate carboxykinase (GTP)
MDEPHSGNPALRAWLRAIVEHARPDRVRWYAGTSAERAELSNAMVGAGQLIKLDPKIHPRSFLYRTDPNDAEPVDPSSSFVSCRKAVDAGPTNNWISREEAHSSIWPLFRDSMRGRTLYVVPYMMGPPHSPFTTIGVQITDSPYIVLCLSLMTRVGRSALDRLGDSKQFFRGLHSLGDLARSRRCVVHFPETAEAWAIGSGNALNALLSQNSHALRSASVQAREDGWLAEHMSLLSLTDPEGQTRYVAAACSSPRELAELSGFASSLPGWQVESLGSDVCWLRPGNDGQLWALNPNVGLCRGLAGAGRDASLGVLASLSSDVLFTNVALRAGGRVWWEGLAALEPGEEVEDWRGAIWTQKGALSCAAHPRATFMVARRNWAGGAAPPDHNQGVPISAILFCGGHARSAPLVYEARSWRHGVFVGATLASDVDGTDNPRSDPMAMRDFCGYNLGDYLEHWLSIGRKLNRPPTVFHVNWFRTGVDGRRLWPGGPENVRVFKWILERVDGSASARSCPLGYVPTEEALDLVGLDLPQDLLMQLLSPNPSAALRQAGRALEFLVRLRDQLPAAMLSEHRGLVRRLQESLH